MKIILRQYILGASMGCLLVFGSCKKTFNTQPSTALVPEDLSGTGGSQTLLNGIYRLMRSSGGDHTEFGIPSLMIADDLLGEDMGMSRFHHFGNDYQYSQVGNSLSGRTAYIWSFFYRIVDNANLILERADTPAAQRGQALALRAFAYFNLVNYYTANPYKEAKEDLAVPLYLQITRNPNPRERVGVLYAQMVKDLEAAIPLLQGFSAPRKSVINQAVAYGLLARTYFIYGRVAKSGGCRRQSLIRG